MTNSLNFGYHGNPLQNIKFTFSLIVFGEIRSNYTTTFIGLYSFSFFAIWQIIWIILLLPWQHTQKHWNDTSGVQICCKANTSKCILFFYYMGNASHLVLNIKRYQCQKFEDCRWDGSLCTTLITVSNVCHFETILTTV